MGWFSSHNNPVQLLSEGVLDFHLGGVGVILWLDFAFSVGVNTAPTSVLSQVYLHIVEVGGGLYLVHTWVSFVLGMDHASAEVLALEV